MEQEVGTIQFVSDIAKSATILMRGFSIDISSAVRGSREDSTIGRHVQSRVDGGCRKAFSQYHLFFWIVPRSHKLYILTKLLPRHVKIIRKNYAFMVSGGI